MNNLLSYIVKDFTYVLERYTFACRNYPHHLPTGDYVRHRTLSEDIASTYLVTFKGIRLPRSFFGVWGLPFSSEVLL